MDDVILLRSFTCFSLLNTVNMVACVGHHFRRHILLTDRSDAKIKEALILQYQIVKRKKRVIKNVKSQLMTLLTRCHVVIHLKHIKRKSFVYIFTNYLFNCDFVNNKK